MSMSNLARYTFAAAGVVALAACSDTTMAPVSRLSAPDQSAAVINPALAGVIVGTGTFANPIAPTELGRTTPGIAFWDNPSSDDGNPWPNANKCNVGYFAVGTLGPVCLNATGGSTPGGFAGGAYYGTGTGNTNAPAFMFSGAYQYSVTLKGAYSSGSSTVGYFTKSGGVYTMHAVAAWSSKSIGTAVAVNTGGLDWGFFATNANFTGVRRCGADPLTLNFTCSDATGGAAEGLLAQQFALFTNSTGTQFLVGLEDNRLEPLWHGDDLVNNPTNRDSDYNDYIFNVTPSVIPGHCTYTKGWYRNNGSNTVTAVDGLTKTQAQDIFEATPGQPGTVSWVGGNDVLNLYQQLLAALLNGGATGPADVKAAITAAQAGTSVAINGSSLKITTTLSQTDISNLIDTLSSFNEGSFAGFPHCS